MSATASESNLEQVANASDAATESQTTTRRLALPAPPPPTTSAPAAEGAVKLDVSSGESVSLYDRMGPTIVNSDGTLSRIVGWHEMGPEERKRILRVLGKRNGIRLEAKKEELGINDNQS
ncbi:hypothetical protein JCM3766R1_005161 [Sporobolomyces carnicolor]